MVSPFFFSECHDPANPNFFVKSRCCLSKDQRWCNFQNKDGSFVKSIFTYIWKIEVVSSRRRPIISFCNKLVIKQYCFFLLLLLLLLLFDRLCLVYSMHKELSVKIVYTLCSKMYFQMQLASQLQQLSSDRPLQISTTNL